MDASEQETLRGSQPADFGGQNVHQFLFRIRTAIGQSTLEVVPHAFIRVQFGGIRRKGFQMQTGRAGEKFLHGVATMSLAIIQQDDQMAVYLA